MTKPFSVRLSADEKAELERQAQGVALGSYIRSALFARQRPLGATATVRRRELSRALAQLGQSDIAASLHELARAARSGSLPLTPETEDQLLSACAAVGEIRSALVSALGLRGARS